ncbi:MAG: hypothetical protein JWO31_672 [Phycisphaerales bacterium]|nr:hypothetical protein [Phycisphaerales bacterium]
MSDEILDTDLSGLVDEQAAPQEARNFDLLPKGDYLAQVEESGKKPTQAGTGTLLKLTWRILEPAAFAGRKLFDNINLTNPNPQAQEIGQRQLASIRAATGVASLKRSEQLHNIPVTLKVRIKAAHRDRKGVDREAANVIDDYLPRSEFGKAPAAASPRQATAPAANVAAPAPATKPLLPWQK